MNYLELERAMARHFHLRQQAELQAARLTGECRLSMQATPAYRQNPDGTAEISYDTFTCHIFRQAGRYQCQLEMCRAEGKAAAANPAQLTNLRRYPIQAMKAWDYGENENPFAALGQYPDLPAAQGGSCEDLPEIRNLQNLFFEHRLHDVRPLFSARADAGLEIEALGLTRLSQCDEVLEREARNAHCYRFLGVTGLPVIEVSPDGTHAQGLFMTQVYQVSAQDWTLHRSFALTASEYVKENGVWKILHMAVRTLVKLPTVPYSTTGRYDRCGQSTLPWPVAQPLGKSPDVRTGMEIENIIQGWAYGCRKGTLPAFIEQHVKNPAGKNRMWIKSFGESTPVLTDLDGILAKITDMTNQYRPGYYTFHAPTTPVLEQLSDNHIQGTWFDCAATNLRSMAKSPEAVPYMVFVNKYTHQFEKIGGKWYLTDFENEPMIALPDWELNMTDNIGWLANSQKEEFPDAFGEELL